MGKMIKRIFDILIILISALLLMPVFILMVFIVRSKLGYPVLFKQSRPGLNGSIFNIYKIRTMTNECNEDGSPLPDEARQTEFGKFLRSTSLDELPSLWNVVKGDMSLVGPRPCLLSQKRLINERKKRGVFKVRPGITGLAQISFITMKKPKLLAKTDSKMIKKMNLFYYFYYIFRTILLIIK